MAQKFESEVLMSDDEVKRRKLYHKLDVVARMNGCEIVDYDVAEKARTKSRIDEFVSMIVYFGVGFFVGAMIILSKVTILR